ncbi:Gly-Xaa carboxypeptidase [Stylosanthes scabra]|uniref:Gly-Xaa carboxypeptidase n=1 Tax=Stylosanthes scabra TaxID=79078 RepID=A0ABU6ZNT6_9FABA|nr:Gly-Xaa carboxypeptidase [Stylosanthes scabra]
MLHKVHTSLLHSLEGMTTTNLDWKQLLKLQSKDGSFLFSPSSTAYAYMQTKDENALMYLDKTVTSCNGAVPNAYPIDLFERSWVVDRLERLGISRYFQPEIKDFMKYVSRYWTDNGIGWTKHCVVPKIDDTVMAFRLLRLHGHQVLSDALKHFEKNGEFFCFAGEISPSVTATFNLYRASQVLFPGEMILEDAKYFAFKFLSEKRASNEIFDKWIITKDLVGEDIFLARVLPGILKSGVIIKYQLEMVEVMIGSKRIPKTMSTSETNTPVFHNNALIIEPTTAEQYVTIEIPQDLIRDYLIQGYTHMHLGAVRLILTLHGKKGLPVTTKVALLDTTFKEYQHVFIGALVTSLTNGSVIHTISPNFTMRLTDPTLSQRIKIQVQLIGVAQDSSAKQAALQH